MRARFAKALKNRNNFKPEGIVTQELINAANAVRLILAKKVYAELLHKETIGCLLATD